MGNWSAAEAWEIVLEQVRPLGSRVLPLSEALGYHLAEEIRADRDLPPADRSSMDGYAVRRADLHRNPCILRLVGEVAAGSPRRPRVKPGACVRIFTGANVPPGADTVVMLEQAEEENGSVTLRRPAPEAANILRRAEDAPKGTELLARGSRLDAMQAGVCAAVGKSKVRVYRQPDTAILCTGSELRNVEDRVRPHEIRDSNGPALGAALHQWGFPGARLRRVADDPATLAAALRRALREHDVVLISGGVSVGRYDYVREAVESAGAKVRFHRVRMRPGRPSLYATAPCGRHIFGLPGNPLSALTAFHEFALPAIRRLAGCPQEDCRPEWPVPLAGAAESDGSILLCSLARLVCREGGMAAALVPSRSSADLVSTGRADGVVLLAESRTHFEAGEMVAFRAWRPLP
jgi:molybdopterin molybdotransferase